MLSKPQAVESSRERSGISCSQRSSRLSLACYVLRFKFSRISFHIFLHNTMLPVSPLTNLHDGSSDESTVSVLIIHYHQVLDPKSIPVARSSIGGTLLRNSNSDSNGSKPADGVEFVMQECHPSGAKLLLETYCQVAGIPYKLVAHPYGYVRSLGHLPVCVVGGTIYDFEAAWLKLRSRWAPLRADETELEPDKVTINDF